MGFFSNIKALIVSAIGIFALFGAYKYKNKSDEVEELSSTIKVKDKEAEALKETVSVQKQVHQQELDNSKLNIDTYK